MKDNTNRLVEYLMAHGVLKNADAEVMAKEIEERVAPEHIKLWCQQITDEVQRLKRENAQLAAAVLVSNSRGEGHISSECLTHAGDCLRDLLAPSEQCIERCGDMLRALGHPAEADVCVAELARLRAVVEGTK